MNNPEQIYQAYDPNSDWVSPFEIHVEESEAMPGLYLWVIRDEFSEGIASSFHYLGIIYNATHTGTIASI